jgi:hypothetical protein
MPGMRTLRSLFISLFLLAMLVVAVPAGAQADELLGRINALRSSLGLPGYTLNGALGAAAQSHAQWMADTGNVSHTGAGGTTPTARAQAAGYPSSFVSENIYMGSIAGINDAWLFWINSAIHYRGLTNPGYTEIGIGVASGAAGNAFALVFGNQGNPYVAPSGGGGNNGNNGAVAAGPPPFIVGYDAVGNIMHEIQPDQTLGDIALIYGYTWDDIPSLLTLNSLTEADMRLLPVGGVFLIPQHGGTYTPSPLPPNVTLTPTDVPPTGTLDPSVPTLTATLDMTVIVGFLQTPSITPEPTSVSGEVVAPRIGTAVGVPDQLIETAEVLPTATALTSPTATPEPGITQIAQLATNIPSQIVIVRENPVSPVLLIAVVVQSLVILAAFYEFMRRLRRK